MKLEYQSGYLVRLPLTWWALCKLKNKIWCSPQGIILDKQGLEFPELTQPDTARIYWLGDISEPVMVAFNKWEKYIRVQCPKARKPTLDYHCTMYYDVSKSEEFEEPWDKQTEH